MQMTRIDMEQVNIKKHNMKLTDTNILHLPFLRNHDDDRD